MKKLTVILLLLSKISFAQPGSQQKPTQFDKFIIKPEIEWAAYINDRIIFANPSLNKLLLLRLDKDEVKAALPVWNGSSEAVEIRYLAKSIIDTAVLFPHNTLAMFDSLGNQAKVEIIPYKLDTATFTLTDITQILYIENNQLKSYIPWVTTTIPVITSNGIFLGNAVYFSICFHSTYNYQLSKKNRISFLSQTKKKISIDSIDSNDKLKELYGRNLVQTLWPYILENKFQIFSVKNNIRLTPEEINTSLVNDIKINETDYSFPVYDSAENIISYNYSWALSPKVFTEVELTQDWYYDHTNNIVFNKIREMYLYTKVWTMRGEAKEASPILKIVF